MFSALVIYFGKQCLGVALKENPLWFFLVVSFEKAVFVSCTCQLHSRFSTGIACRLVNKTKVNKNACLEMKNGISSGNFFRFVRSLFYWFRALTANKTRLWQPQLKQVNNYYYFVVPSSVYCVYVVSFARKKSFLCKPFPFIGKLLLVKIIATCRCLSLFHWQ